MNEEDVEKNVTEKRFHNDQIMEDKFDSGDKVGVLIKKEKFDKGNKIKLEKGSHEVVKQEGYSFILDNKRSHPSKDLVKL